MQRYLPPLPQSLWGEVRRKLQSVGEAVCWYHMSAEQSECDIGMTNPAECFSVMTDVMQNDALLHNVCAS